MLSGCQGKSDPSQALQPTGQAVTASNSGSEDSQKVTITVNYGQKLNVAEGAEKNLKITISDKKVKSSKYTIARKDGAPDQLVVTIDVDNGIEEGHLVIQTTQADSMLDKVTDEKGWPVGWKTIDCLIPTGLTLDTVSAVTGAEGVCAKVVKKVQTTQQVRGVTWFRLLDNGLPVAGAADPASAKMEGAVAVHGHEFLTDTTETIAEAIADVLNTNFKDKYKITSDGDQFSVEALNTEVGEKIDVQVYLY